MKIRISNQQKIKVSAAAVKKLVKFVLREEGLKEANIEISVLLVDNRRIKSINKEYLRRNRPTDVISFRMWEGPFDKLHSELLGDVVVSVEKARKEAKILRKYLNDELFLYIIHGILHLLGYEDNDDVSSERMNRRCGEILGKFKP